MKDAAIYMGPRQMQLPEASYHTQISYSGQTGFSRSLVSTSYTSTHCEISFDANQIFTDVYTQTPAWTSKFYLFNRFGGRGAGGGEQDCKLHLSRQIWGLLCPSYAANYITQ